MIDQETVGTDMVLLFNSPAGTTVRILGVTAVCLNAGTLTLYVQPPVDAAALPTTANLVWKRTLAADDVAKPVSEIVDAGAADIDHTAWEALDLQGGCALWAQGTVTDTAVVTVSHVVQGQISRSTASIRR